MSVTDRIDAFQQRHRWAGFPIAVIYKYGDDQGPYLAALITYYGFLSLFPLLLLLVTILGYALQNNPGLRADVLHSALRQFPAIGDDLGKNLVRLQGSWVALTVGILGSLYGAIGVAQALQNAFNRAWAVPRAERPNPLKARVRSLLFLLVIVAGLVLTTGLSILTARAGIFGQEVNVLAQYVSLVLSVAIDVPLFLAIFKVLTARDVTARQVLPGSVIAAVLWESLQLFGNYYVNHHVRGATATYGSFALVLGLLAYLLLASVAVVLCAEINVVRTDRLWPRSLLTPFTDDVVLTDADRRAYTGYPNTERHKGFETVDVGFGDAHRKPDRNPKPDRDTPATGS